MCLEGEKRIGIEIIFRQFIIITTIKFFHKRGIFKEGNFYLFKKDSLKLILGY